MRVAQIRAEDIANGPGVRVSIHVQGCLRHCKDCFNKETWDFDGGYEFSDILKQRFLELGKPDKIKGFSILGGEPLQQDKDMIDLVKSIKELYPDKSIWLWTGYKYEELLDNHFKVLEYIDVLVDGEFVVEQKNPGKLYAGSDNQRLIDVQKTLETGGIVTI